jgi:exodeoxyribonuclease VII large subunit
MLDERAGGALGRLEAALAERAAKLDSMSPLAVLGRGYSIAYHAGKILKKATDASPGDEINIRLHEGSLQCAVEKVEE